MGGGDLCKVGMVDTTVLGHADGEFEINCNANEC